MIVHLGELAEEKIQSGGDALRFFPILAKGRDISTKTPASTAERGGSQELSAISRRRSRRLWPVGPVTTASPSAENMGQASKAAREDLR